MVLFWERRGYAGEGRECVEEALSRSDGAPSSLRRRALEGAGTLAMLSGDFAGSLAFTQAALDLARAIGDARGMALSLSRLALRSALAKDHEQAMALGEEGLVRAHEAGDPWLIGLCLQLHGVAVRSSGDIERAAALFRDSLALTRQVGDKWSIAFVLLNVGGVAQAQGDTETARRAYQEALSLGQELQDRRGMAWCLECLEEVAAAEQQPQRAARLMGAAEGLLESLGASWPPTYVAGRERSKAVICAAIGEEAFSTVWAEGRAMGLEQAVGYALEGSDKVTG
jgi:tetratricopeptide (TPR) repeat protein